MAVLSLLGDGDSQILWDVLQALSTAVPDLDPLVLDKGQWPFRGTFRVLINQSSYTLPSKHRRKGTLEWSRAAYYLGTL